MKTHTIEANGRPGKDGSLETRASDGVVDGEHGRNGRDASLPLEGGDGGIIDISISTKQGETWIEGCSRQQSIRPTAFSMETNYYLSAQGGKGGDGGIGGTGGNGATGRRGHNATRYRSGGNGGPGGDAGDAGAGSNGSDGGKGGEINIRIKDEDSYLLMAFACCDQASDAVRGGFGGKRGVHGDPGTPGKGGRGGSSYSWTTTHGSGENQRTVHHHNPGGHSGRNGREGRKVTHRLKDGKQGKNGKVSIHVTHTEDLPKEEPVAIPTVVVQEVATEGVPMVPVAAVEPITASLQGQARATMPIAASHSCHYSHRYDLRLGVCSIDSPQRLKEQSHVFQFTDRVDITGMTCMNEGGMVSPIQGTNVHFKEGAAYKYILPNLDTMGWFQRRLVPGTSGPIQGGLSFIVQAPNIREFGDDMEPHRVQEKLVLGATQLGAFGFQREHPHFHKEGILLDFRFPVENQTKLEGLPTICSGDGTHVKFDVTNTSLRDLGVGSQDKRKLVVQFYLNGRDRYDIPSHHIDLCIDGVDCNSKLKKNSGTTWRGTQLPINSLVAGQTKTFNGTLKLSPQVTPYSRVGIQAEILLQELAHADGETKPQQMIPIQRRQLEVSTEPSYLPSKSNHVVLVSCATTTKKQFNSWSNLLTQKLGLKVGYYSVSIYGSLDPKFRPPKSDITLAEAFAGKLIVVLDNAFNPLDESVSKMEPSRMLPNGCQSQTSGYDSSTKWLLVGSSDDAVKRALVAHYTAPPNDATTYDSVSAFKKELNDQLQKERKDGRVSDERICEAAIRVRLKGDVVRGTGKRLTKKASKVKAFLEQADPLRQYIVEPRSQVVKEQDGKGHQLLIIRRGYLRTANTTNVLKRAKPPTKEDRSAVLALVGSLPHNTLHLVFANAVSTQDEALLEVVLDVFTQHLLWDVANIIDGGLNVRNSGDVASALHTLNAVAGSSTLKAVANSSGGEGRKALSRLVARIECIARSRDLNPWLLPFDPRHTVRKALVEMVTSLKKDWAFAILKEDRRKEIERVETEVLDYLRKTYGFPLRSRSASRWRKGLLFVCSYRNTVKYPVEQALCGPTIRLIEMETTEYTKKSRAIAPTKTITTENSCSLMRKQADEGKAMAAQLLKSIQETRNRQGVGDKGEIEVQL